MIVSTPIISRTVAARVKLLGDRLLGPNADAAIIEELVRIKQAGGEPAVPFRVDERVLKPRVAGFIAVGGSLTPQWKTLTLPVLHTLTFSMQIAVVDQVQFEGAGTPRSIVLDDAALARAGELGRTVAEQAGRRFEDAEYRGEPGLCPLCHLDVVVLRGREVECATCGARGSADGRRRALLRRCGSVITMRREARALLRDPGDRAAPRRAARGDRAPRERVRRLRPLRPPEALERTSMAVDVVCEREIPRPREEVAAYAADPDHTTEWYANIKAVEWETPRPLAVGSRLAFIASFLGRRLSYTYEIRELVPGERLVMSTAQGPFPMETTYTWEDAGDGATRMTMRNRGEPSGFAKVGAPVMTRAMKRAMRQDLERLSRILVARP